MGILILRSSAASGSVDGNDGLVVSDFANFDPDAAQIISLDVNSTLTQKNSTGASVSIADES